jgi:hypothetical protein
MAPPERRPALSKATTKAHPIAPTGDAVVTEIGASRPIRTAETPETPETPESTSQARPGAEGLTATLSARVPLELRDAVKIYAVRHRASVQEVVIEAMEQFLAK